MDRVDYIEGVGSVGEFRQFCCFSCSACWADITYHIFRVLVILTLQHPISSQSLHPPPPDLLYFLK